MMLQKWCIVQQGTNYRSVIYHEFGHLFQDAHPEIDIIKIARAASNTSNKYEFQSYVGETLSLYAAKFSDGREILSECFSSYFNSNENNEFVLRIMKECGIVK